MSCDLVLDAEDTDDWVEPCLVDTGDGPAGSGRGSNRGSYSAQWPQTEDRELLEGGPEGLGSKQVEALGSCAGLTVPISVLGTYPRTTLRESGRPEMVRNSRKRHDATFV